MQARKFPSVPAIAVTAVLVLAVALLIRRGLVEALVTTAFVAGLTGMYLLRRYARAETVYRRDAEPPAGPPATPDEAHPRRGIDIARRAPVADNRQTTAPSVASASAGRGRPGAGAGTRTAVLDEVADRTAARVWTRARRSGEE